MHRFFILLISFLLISGCKECSDKNCENGYCLGDRCVCDEGYTGEHCESESQVHLIDTGVGFYTTCSSCAGLAVSVDGGAMREFDYYFFAPTANCGHEEVIRFNLNAGTHSYSTNDGRSGYFEVEDNHCKTIRIE